MEEFQGLPRIKIRKKGNSFTSSMIFNISKNSLPQQMQDNINSSLEDNCPSSINQNSIVGDKCNAQIERTFSPEEQFAEVETIENEHLPLYLYCDKVNKKIESEHIGGTQIMQHLNYIKRRAVRDAASHHGIAECSNSSFEDGNTTYIDLETRELFYNPTESDSSDDSIEIVAEIRKHDSTNIKLANNDQTDVMNMDENKIVLYRNDAGITIGTPFSLDRWEE